MAQARRLGHYLINRFEPGNDFLPDFKIQPVDILLDYVLGAGNGLGFFEPGHRFLQVAAVLLQFCEVGGELFHDEPVILLLIGREGGIDFFPLLDAIFPNILRPVGIVITLLVKPAQLEQDVVAAGTIAEALVQDGSASLVLFILFRSQKAVTV